jgi:hypothetical protein
VYLADRMKHVVVCGEMPLQLHILMKAFPVNGDMPQGCADRVFHHLRVHAVHKSH